MPGIACALRERGGFEKDQQRARRGLCTSQLPCKLVRSPRTHVSPTFSILPEPSEFLAKCRHREETHQILGDSSFSSMSPSSNTRRKSSVCSADPSSLAMTVNRLLGPQQQVG